MKAKELMRMLEKDGWRLERVSGSHHMFRHPVKHGLIPVPQHSGDLGKGLAHNILKRAGLK